MSTTSLDQHYQYLKTLTIISKEWIGIPNINALLREIFFGELFSSLVLLSTTKSTLNINKNNISFHTDLLLADERSRDFFIRFFVVVDLSVSSQYNWSSSLNSKGSFESWAISLIERNWRLLAISLLVGTSSSRSVESKSV